MDSEKESSFSSVLSVNPYTNEYVSSISSFLKKSEKPEFAKDQLVTSYINSKTYINNQISLSKNIPDEDIDDALNIKIYDELGLDQAVEYQFKYFETFANSDGENRNFQVFIVDPLDLQSTFTESIAQIKYIDSITPSPLLIKSLYSKEILQESGIHCFVYLEKSDAFIAIYNEKELVYTKSLKYSFEEMHERFCELYGEKVDYEDFLRFLSTENLKYTESDFKSYILKLYREIFSTINDILTYVKKAYEIEKVQNVFIGSQIEMASKLYEIAEVELGIESNDFNFDYGFSNDDLFVDQIHALLQITSTLPEEEKYSCNFSSYDRPPKFLKRESGKFSLVLTGSLVLAFIYPVTYWTLTYMQELQYQILNDQYKKIHAEKVTREANIKTKEAEKKRANTLLKVEKENYQSKKDTLTKIHNVKVNYPMKAKLITALAEDLNKFSVKVQKITYSEELKTNRKEFTLYLQASNDKKITNLLEYLTKKYDKKFEFALQDISLEDTKDTYISEIKVNLL